MASSAHLAEACSRVVSHCSASHGGHLGGEGMSLGRRTRLGSKLAMRSARMGAIVAAAADAPGTTKRERAFKSGGLTKNITLVDPLVAKRMALDELREIKEAERRQRLRDIEAANGAWATFGLFAAVIGENTSKEGIIGQIALYIEFVANTIERVASWL